MNERTCTLVHGYHNVTPAPQLAMDNKLTYRTAIVVDTDSDVDDSAVFHEDIFFTCIQEISELIQFNRLKIVSEGNQVLDSIDTFKAVLKTIPIDNREPPEHIIYYDDTNTVVSLMETEYWLRFGGPQPYSDSYTYSFYTTTYMGKEIQNACDNASKISHFTIKEVVTGSH